jgi:hypothetical protein
VRQTTRKLAHLLLLTLALGSLLPEAATAAPNKPQNADVCVVEWYNGRVTRTLVFQDVPPLSPGRAVSLRGVIFSAAQITLPFDGSAAMAASGMVRLGIFVHSGARRSTISAPDFLLSGETDTSFSGVFHLKYDGEIYPSSLVTLEPEDCAAITIP